MTTAKKIDTVWLGRAQVARHLGVHRQTIWRWENEGLLPPPDGRDPYGNAKWRVTTIDAFIEKGAA